MKGDFSRDTFDPARHYSRVLMQQGRVQLDADCNEQSAILLHYLRTVTRDVVGPHAGPANDCGFEIITEETSHRLDAIADEGRRNYLRAEVRKGNFVVGPGHYYVDGILVENERAILYSEQRGYPFAGTPGLEDLEPGMPALVYLDVWERHVTSLEDDHIREVALEGLDTCTRAQVVWQVKVLIGSDDEAGAKGPFGCDAVDGLPRLGTGRLRARVHRGQPGTGRLASSPSSRYQGTRNHLYRVEVHHGGSGGTPATYKWSRDNGSVTFPIRQLANGTAILGNLGTDGHLSLKPGDWVEVIDDAIALAGQPGVLAQVNEVVRDDLRVTLSVPGSLPPRLPAYGSAEAGLHPLLRRWDQLGDPAFGGALRIAETSDPPGAAHGWIDIEDGVQIWFSAGGHYLSGDYWLIPACVTTGDVEWPHQHDATGAVDRDADGNPVAAARHPAGVYHSFAPLWLGTGAGAGPVTGHDCRRLISPCRA
jgi:hypothetical protein